MRDRGKDRNRQREREREKERKRERESACNDVIVPLSTYNIYLLC